MSLQIGVATVAEAAGQDLADCPLLLENKSTGPCVVTLQQELNAVNPAYGLTASGNFDAPTRIAVLDFQGRNHLGADGNVGRTTAVALQAQFDALSGSTGPAAGGAAASPATVTCTPDVTSGPPSASIPPDRQAYFQCSDNGASGGGGQTTATEVTCTPDVASGPPSASIPPDLQRNFHCFPTGGGGDLSPECVVELLSATAGL